LRIATVSSAPANAWYSWNSGEPSVSFGSPGARESVTLEKISFFSCSRGANSGMVLS
jgi:hypothetical protein